MEKPIENTSGETSAPSKSHYVSMDEWIAKMKLAFTNAQLPAILPYFVTVGYTKESFENMLNETIELENLSQAYKREQSEQYEETEKFNKQKDSVNETFLRHRDLCRVLFRKNLAAQTILMLNQATKTAYANWIQLVLNFYGQLSASETLKADVAKLSISEADISQALEAIASLQALKESQKKEASEAQVASEVRDKAFDAIHEKYREVMDYAKVLLKDNQHLEAMGVVVKR